MERARLVREFVLKRQWLSSCKLVRFLAAGEYNENYYLEDDTGRASVFRINHGSQLGLEKQISYEFDVLRAAEKSGVSPAPFFVSEEAGDLGRGAMLMQFCPGRRLDYSRDLEKAARIFAAVHSLPVSEKLIRQENPIEDIARESLMLLNRFPQSARQAEKKKLLQYHESIIKLAEKNRDLFLAERPSIVNTEVNSGNFLINDQHSWLVDWEKAVVSSPSQDLGHFMVITTTRWKTDYVLSEEEKMDFCRAYKKFRGFDEELDLVREKARLLEKTILLRGLSWCFMAWHEYQSPNRQLKNEETFKKIEDYLSGIDQLLDFNC